MLFTKTGYIIALLIAAIFLVALGGALDMTGREGIGPMSKHHLWVDGTFLAILSGWLLLWRHAINVRPRAEDH